MDVVELARWQFAITTVYHFFFVPLTLGLALALAVMETVYVLTGVETWKQMVKFWGKLFLINFAMGVVTGIVQEFQFGMNWSEYSRFVGDIFGAPLAIEALMTFFLESVFIGVWVFGWNKLAKVIHAFAMWMIAIGSFFSAFWIMAANSFMQHPVGYELVTGDNGFTRAEMVDFFALLKNPHFHPAITHVMFAGLTVAAFFILCISSYHILRKSPQIELFITSFKFGALLAIGAAVIVSAIGHLHAQNLDRTQPMKLAASEALWETMDPAPFAIFAVPNREAMRNDHEILIPAALSLLCFNVPQGEVRGIRELQQKYEAMYGPGDYCPPVAPTFWSFRIMIVAGGILVLLAFYAMAAGFFVDFKQSQPRGLRVFLYAVFLPYIACTAGWIMTEVGRQPWVVYGLMRTRDAVSKSTTVAEIMISLVGFTVVYGALMAVDIFLLVRFSTKTSGSDD